MHGAAKELLKKSVRNPGTRWAGAAATLAATTAAARLAHLNATSAGFAFLVAVLAISVRGGLLVGTVSAVAATLAFNFFFFAPLYTFTIHAPENWVALVAFLVVSVTVNRLVLAARVEAERARARTREVEALWSERERLLEERAHLQAVHESEELKTSLLRAVSHDLTTPITALSIRVDSLLAAPDLDPRLAEGVAAVAEEAARLRRRIENLLSMARLEAGRARPRREPAPPADLFRAVRENLPIVFCTRPVTLRVDEDCPDANVDPSLTLEILVNLVENAHRASSPGAPVELVARRHPAEAERVRLEVLDRGPGIPEGITASDGSVVAAHAAREGAPRGLGLEIARSFAAANGGALSLVPREGGGTAARVDLPAA